MSDEASVHARCWRPRGWFGTRSGSTEAASSVRSTKIWVPNRATQMLDVANCNTADGSGSQRGWLPKRPYEDQIRRHHADLSVIGAGFSWARSLTRHPRPSLRPSRPVSAAEFNQVHGPSRCRSIRERRDLEGGLGSLRRVPSAPAETARHRPRRLRVTGCSPGHLNTFLRDSANSPRVL